MEGKEVQNLTSLIRELLDRLVACRQLTDDEQEVIGDEVMAEARALPREGILEALDKATGSSRLRRQESVFILSELTDVTEVVDGIGEWIRDPDPSIRSWLIQAVEQKRLKQFAPFLNAGPTSEWFKADESKSTRGIAAWGLGKLGDKNAAIARLTWREKSDWHSETLRLY